MSAIRPTENSPSIGSCLSWAVQELSRVPFDNPELEARYLLSGLLKWPLTDLYVYPDRALSRNDYLEFQKMVARRARREPVSYILGWHRFIGSDLTVDRRVLIPRPETEQLVEAAAAWLRNQNLKAPKILDLGTGSGCIALGLLHLVPGAQILAADISIDALNLARTNARSEKNGENVAFLHSDLYNGLEPELSGYFDMIISNPPYISTSELSELEADLSYEPRVALDGGKTGLEIINRLVRGAPAFLRKKGLLIFEIGYRQGLAAQGLCQSAGFDDIEILKDYQGHDRIIKGVFRGPV